jgi:hypothetical protein
MAIRSKLVMMTCPGRNEAALETFNAFRDVGAPFDLVQRQAEPPSLRMNGVNYTRALKAMRGHDVLVVEDDVIPANTLPAWIEWIENHGFTVPVLLYAWQARYFDDPEIAAAFDAGGPAPHRMVPLGAIRNWSGTIAVWWPREFHETMLKEERFFWEAYELEAMDLELRKYCIERGITPMVVVPNLVQHRDYPRITGGGAPHKSNLFDADAMPPKTRQDAPEATRTPHPDPTPPTGESDAPAASDTLNAGNPTPPKRGRTKE